MIALSWNGAVNGTRINAAGREPASMSDPAHGGAIATHISNDPFGQQKPNANNSRTFRRWAPAHRTETAESLS